MSSYIEDSTTCALNTPFIDLGTPNMP